jgi:hypothetical protein
MNSLAQHRGEGSHRRASALVLLAAVVAAATIAMAMLAPASSFGVEPPAVTSVNPAGGPVVGGTAVEIKGVRFTGATQVKFGSTGAASFTVISKSLITATSPAGTGAVDVTVTTPSGTSATGPADRFTYGPNVTGVSPNRGPASGGTSVTVTGSDLSAATAVMFGSTGAASFKVNSQSSITAVAPEGTGTVDVTVSDAEATSPVSSADQFSYVPAPAVTSVSPAGGPEAGGTEVTITVAETNLNEVTSVDFGLTPALFFVNNEGSITAFSPAGAGVVDVTVTAFGGASATSPADQFRYVPPPTVTAVSPETGVAGGGAGVTVTGTNFGETPQVSFGSVSATSVVVGSESSITAVAPKGTPGETVDVTVTTLGGTSPTSAADRFRYLQTGPLLVTKVSPGEGAFTGGTPVTVAGSAFVGATAVDFGSTSATSFIVIGQHKLKAVAPPGTGAVDVTVTTPEGTSPTSSADLFSYVSAPPSVESVSPSEAREKGGTKIVIKGANFFGATEVHFGSASATSFVVNSKGTGITAVDPAVADKATVDVTVTTPEGASAVTPADRFTYLIALPLVTSVSPHEGPAGGGTSVSIVGEHFIEVTAVTFGSVSATSFTVNSAGSITAVAPAQTVGRVSVLVTTPVGTSTLGQCKTIVGEEGPYTECISKDQFKVVEPTITSVTPNAGSTAGGDTVTVQGTGFGLGATATTFVFGSTPAASVNCTSSMTCTVVAPAHAAGTVDVKATIPGANVVRKTTHKNRPGDQYTYE